MRLGAGSVINFDPGGAFLLYFVSQFGIINVGILRLGKVET